LSSADPGKPPGSPISANRGASDAAPGARLRSHAQDAAGFDPDLARADDPEPAAPDDPEHLLADEPERVTPDDPERAKAGDRNRAG